MVARLLLTALLTLTPLTPALAQTQTAPTPTLVWASFTPPEGHFTALFPGTPQRQEQITPDGPGKGAKNVLFFSVVAPTIYMTAWADYPEGLNLDPDAEMAANRDNFLGGLNATLTSSIVHKTGAYTGIEFVGSRAQFTDSAGKVQPALQIRGRVYMQGRRPLMAAVVTNPDNAGAPDNTRFLDSFKPR